MPDDPFRNVKTDLHKMILVFYREHGYSGIPCQLE